MHFRLWGGFYPSSLLPTTTINVENLGLLNVALFTQRHKLPSDFEKLVDVSIE